LHKSKQPSSADRRTSLRAINLRGDVGFTLLDVANSDGGPTKKAALPGASLDVMGI